MSIPKGSILQNTHAQEQSIKKFEKLKIIQIIIQVYTFNWTLRLIQLIVIDSIEMKNSTGFRL